MAKGAITPKPIKLTEADIARFWSKVDRRGSSECWEWRAYRKGGYGRFRLNNFTYYANRVAYVIINGDTELDVLHDCDHPWCCNPNHLYAGTAKDNSGDREDRGRGVQPDTCGEENGRAKLTEFDTRKIRRLHAAGKLLCEIAEEFGISRSQVSRIGTGKRWKHV